MNINFNDKICNYFETLVHNMQDMDLSKKLINNILCLKTFIYQIFD